MSNQWSMITVLTPAIGQPPQSPTDEVWWTYCRTLYDVADGKFGVHDASFFGMEYHKGFKVRAAPLADPLFL
jgi:hypothetical protein